MSSTSVFFLLAVLLDTPWVPLHFLSALPLSGTGFVPVELMMFRPEYFLLWETVLCIVVCLKLFLASDHEMPVASPSCDNKNRISRYKISLFVSPGG